MTAKIEASVLNNIEEHPQSSTRKIAVKLNISHVIVFKILDIYLSCSKCADDFPLRVDCAIDIIDMK